MSAGSMPDDARGCRVVVEEAWCADADQRLHAFFVIVGD